MANNKNVTSREPEPQALPALPIPLDYKYIVNNSGIIHTVALDVLLAAGERLATDIEAAYYERPNSDCVAAKAVEAMSPASEA